MSNRHKGHSMSLDISSENQQFLDAAVASGEFASREAAINRAVSLLRQRHEAIHRLCSQLLPLPELPTILEWQSEGYIGVRGHRIGLHLILERYFAGASRAELADWFSTLTSEELDQVLEFVGQHPDAMRAYLERQEALARLLLDESNQGPSLAELRARWETKFGRPYVSPCR
jgi:Arc/MetJ-type ribon-helix-helix transcriptional regulator/uncharacterized protein (DUF433 family)